MISEQNGTSLEFVTDGCLHGFSESEIDLIARMSLNANRGDKALTLRFQVVRR